MNKPILKIENLSKQYRLGVVGTGTISHDLNRWWHTVRGKEDPYLKIGESNDRATKGASKYVWALKDINIEVQEGEVLGIIGKNGAGKSTLLKILSRVTGPTTGSIKSRGRIASLLEVGTGFHPELTGKENIFLNGAILGMTKAEINDKLDEIVDFSGVARYLDTPVKRYSSGMKVRLAFAVAAHLEPDILVVDEVLAVGDAEFQKKAIGKMQDISKGDGRTVLFVSHNMAAVKSLCTRGVLLVDGEIVKSGTTNSIIETYLQNNTVSLNNKKLYTGDKTGIIEIFNKFTKSDVIVGSDFTYGITFLSKVNRKKLVFKFQILDNYGTILTTINTYHSHPNEINVEKGEKLNISFTINNLNLIEGNYYINLTILSLVKDQSLFWNKQIDSFKISEVNLNIKSKSIKSQNFGYITFDPKWKIKKQ